MPIILQPVDQIAHAELAQRLACWAKTEDGLTDRALEYQSCCVSPTGQTLGRWVVPEDLCAVYGPFNFTGNEGQVIPCPSVGSAEYLNYYIYDDDVHGIDPNTCVEVTLAAPTGLTSPTQGPTTVDLAWDAVDGAETYIVRWSLAGQNDWTELPPTALLTAEVSGLSDETSYDFQVQAKAVGSVDSPWSATLTQATTSLGTLAAPTGLANPSSTGTTMDITWNEVENATAYTVEWSLVGEGNWTTAQSPDTTYTITGLTIGTSYDVRVKATAPDWTDSPYSAQIIGSTEQQLATPAGLASPSQTGTTVSLTWTAVPNATTYVVQRSPAGAGTWTALPAVGTNALTATGLAAGTSYDWQVKAQAMDFVDSAWSATLTQATAAALATPVLGTSGQTDTSVTLTWGAIANATSYTLQWAPTSGGQWTAMPNTALTTQTVTGLSAGTSYKFRVLAHASGWTDSAWSSEFTQPTWPALLAPANFAAGTPTTTTMPLSWDAAVNAETYTVAWSPTGAGTWTDVPAVATTSTTVTGLTAGTVYDFRIKSSATGFADSGWSSTLTEGTALTAPTGLDTTDGLMATEITMQWNAVTGAATYVMRWSLAGQNVWTELPATADTNDTATGLTPETSYDLQVKAQGPGLTDSDWSATHTVSTTATPQLDAPTGMASPAQTATTVDLTWTAIVGADNYVVRWSPAGAGTWTEQTPVATNADTVSGLTASTSYDFQAKATGTGWVDSDWSTTFTQATTA